MIPEDRFSTVAHRGSLLSPWSRDRKISYQWGPVQVQDPSQGLLVKIWTATVLSDNEVWLSSDTNAPVLLFTWTSDISNVSLAFDHNGFPNIAFSDVLGQAQFYWWDPVPNEFVFFPLPLGASSPICTLDDARPFALSRADVLLFYIKDEAVMYRQQRDRYTVEYLPTEGELGPSVNADILYHVSMNKRLRLEIVYGNLPAIIDAPNIMKKQILIQKAQGETLPITFNFQHLMLFGEVIVAAAVVVTVQSGEDAEPELMLAGALSHTDWEVTQKIQGGEVGVAYRISMSARTNNDCVYVVEGLLSISDAPSLLPEIPE